MRRVAGKPAKNRAFRRMIWLADSLLQYNKSYIRSRLDQPSLSAKEPALFSPMTQIMPF